MEKYDVVVVGAGAGGVFLTYELCRRKFSGTVLALERGRAWSSGTARSARERRKRV